MVNCKKVIAFITAAGTGTRMQLSIPKQFLTINDVPVCFYLMKQLQDNELVDEIAIAIPYGWNEYVKTFAEHLGVKKLKFIVLGGNTVLESIMNIADAVSINDKDYVMCINDGDRMLFDNILNVVLSNFSANGDTVPYWTPYDITYYNEDNLVKSLDRDKTMVTVTPHAFLSSHVNEAIKHAKESKLEKMYLNLLLNELGYKVNFIKAPSSRYDIKLTYLHDIDIVKAVLKQKGVFNYGLK